MIISNIVGKVWGADPIVVPAPAPLSNDVLPFGGVSISSYQIALIVLTILLVAVVERGTADRGEHTGGIDGDAVLGSEGRNHGALPAGHLGQRNMDGRKYNLQRLGPEHHRHARSVRQVGE